MKSELQSFARTSGKRARVKARRLAVMLRLYQSDPVRNFGLRSESANLAKSVAYYLRQAELVGRIIISLEEGQRQSIKVDEQVGKESVGAFRYIREPE